MKIYEFVTAIPATPLGIKYLELLFTQLPSKSKGSSAFNKYNEKLGKWLDTQK